MRSLARLGRHVQGLRAFADFRYRLVQELGVSRRRRSAVERQPLAHTARRRSTSRQLAVGRHDEHPAGVESLDGRGRPR